MTDIGSDVPGEVNAGIAGVSRMMERLETRENSSANPASVANHIGDFSVTEQNNQNIAETNGESPLNDSNQPASCTASSASG